VTLEQVRESNSLFKAFDRAARPYKQLLDIHVAQHFGVERAGEFLKLYGADALQADPEKLAKPYLKVIEQARALYEEKRFFHWDLEFPEVFIDLDRAAWKDNGGFDAVVGNPPYVPTEQMLVIDRAYYAKRYPVASGKYDLSVVFIVRAYELSADSRRFGMIVPTTWQTGNNYIPFRKQHFSQGRFGPAIVVNLPFDVFPDAYIDTAIAIFAKPSSKLFYAFAYPKKFRIDNIDLSRRELVETPMSALTREPGCRLFMNNAYYELLRKLETSACTKLGDITDSCQGPVESFFEYSQTPRSDDYVPYYSCEVDRYDISIADKKYIKFGRNNPLSTYYAQPRVLIRRIVSRSDRLMAVAVDIPFVVRKDLNPFIITEDGYSHYYTLANVNSMLHSYLYVESSTSAGKDDFRQTTLSALAMLPVRRINFTTDPEERKLCNTELVRMYIQQDNEELLKEVKEMLPRSTDGDFLAFKPGSTGAEEKSDVVHDFLAYLAEQMIEMHKEKQTHVEAFWQDLAAATDPATFETLRNKGKWQQSLAKDPVCAPYVDAESRSTRNLDESLGWDEACFEVFAGMLVGRTAVTPALVRVYRKHAPDYRALVTRIDETDTLIDQIVYRLYGLTEEEIAVVEGR